MSGYMRLKPGVFKGNLGRNSLSLPGLGTKCSADLRQSLLKARAIRRLAAGGKGREGH